MERKTLSHRGLQTGLDLTYRFQRFGLEDLYRGIKHVHHVQAIVLQCQPAWLTAYRNTGYLNERIGPQCEKSIFVSQCDVQAIGNNEHTKWPMALRDSTSPLCASRTSNSPESKQATNRRGFK